MSSGHMELPREYYETFQDDGNDYHSALIYSLSPDGMKEDPDGEWVKVGKCRYARVHRLETRTNDANLQQAFDTVQRPAHYNQSGIECIDAIAASMSAEEFRGFLKGNAQKYLWRCEHKGGVEDLNKAQWYLNRLIKELSK